MKRIPLCAKCGRKAVMFAGEKKEPLCQIHYDEFCKKFTHSAVEEGKKK